MSLSQVLAMLLIASTLFDTWRALHVSPDALPGTQAYRFGGAVTSALIAVWVVLPWGSVACWLALGAAASMFVVQLRAGLRLGRAGWEQAQVRRATAHKVGPSERG
jgi:ABC-type uncharacterized transport system permease subunit